MERLHFELVSFVALLFLNNLSLWILVFLLTKFLNKIYQISEVDR